MGSLAGLWMFFMYFRTKQFEDCEEIKYQVFREEEGNGESVLFPQEEKTENL